MEVNFVEEFSSFDVIQVMILKIVEWSSFYLPTASFVLSALSKPIFSPFQSC